MIEFEPVVCGQCGAQVCHMEGEKRITCETCGSTARKFEVQISETIEVRVGLGMKAKHEGATGRHKWFVESYNSWSLHRDSGEMRKLSRVIDRENDRYQERVSDQFGTVHRNVDEPLSKHQSRGDAKPKT